VPRRAPYASACKQQIFGTLEAQVSQLDLFDERIDNADRIVLTDVVIKALGQQRDLATVFAFDESLH
jgi:hypothetical protein